MNRYFKIILSVFSVVIFYTETISAADTGRASVYKVTMERNELCEDAACLNYTTLCSTSKVADIASVSAGTDVGNWCALTGLPIGRTYTHVRVRLHRAFTIQGYVVDKSGTTDCYTSSTTAGTATTLAFGGESADATGETLVEQEIWLYDARGNGVAAYITSSSGSVDITWPFYTHASRPVGATSWCVGTTAGTHTNAAGVCADTNTQSTTWDDNATATSLQIIYPLASAYTVGPIAPKLTLTFDTSEGLGAEFFGGARCEMTVGQVKFTANLSE
jgi:hypothetical protein